MFVQMSRRMFAFSPPPPKENKFPRNNEITAPSVRLVEEGKATVMTLVEALNRARAANLDLVQTVAPRGTNPAIVTIVNHSKFVYEADKKARQQQLAARSKKLKIIQLKPNIDEHDLGIKMSRAQDFLGDGCEVKVEFTARDVTAANKPVVNEKWNLIKERLKPFSANAEAKFADKLFYVFQPGKAKHKQKADGEGKTPAAAATTTAAGGTGAGTTATESATATSAAPAAAAASSASLAAGSKQPKPSPAPAPAASTPTALAGAKGPPLPPAKPKLSPEELQVIKERERELRLIKGRAKRKDIELDD
jgi:translation initiation factor IF-3